MEEGSPEVSIIVPVFNEEERIEQNLLSLLTQQDAPSYEIIYVDDASTDGSWDRLISVSNHAANLRTYRLKDRRTVGSVRALAVSLSRGRVIANMDADCVAPPRWLNHCQMLRGDVGVVGFPVIPPSDLEYLHWRFHYLGAGQYPPGSMPHGCGALIRKDLLLKAGNFRDTKLGEDTEMFVAISHMGARVVLLERPAMTLLQKRTTLASHLGRYYAMGQNAATESRNIYVAVLAAILVLSALAAVFWGRFPWVSIVSVLSIMGLLTNPRRVRQYVESFELPRNRVAKTICFSSIKMLETLSILVGYVTSLEKRWRARAKLNSEIPVG